ncbi:MAG: DUF4230 domain-containing protein [Anaerolineae bacterium]|nr:DUF4230 domain-containing protein [Anaerolineae bacterium]
MGKKQDVVIEGHVRKRREVVVPDDDYAETDEWSEPPLRARKRRRAPGLGCLGMWRMVAGLSTSVTLVIFGCLFLVMMVGVLNFMRDPLDNFLSVFGFDKDAAPVEVDSRTVVLGIREMAILETTIGDIEITKTVIDASAAPDAELRVSFIGQARVGIDLSLITDEDVIVNPDGSLTIVLPPAQLTGCFLGKPDILHRSCTDIPMLQDCGKIIERMQEKAYDRAIDALRETAYELALLDQAYLKAEASIYELLNSLGYENIEFQRSEEEVLPDETCFPTSS